MVAWCLHRALSPLSQYSGDLKAADFWQEWPGNPEPLSKSRADKRHSKQPYNATPPTLTHIHSPTNPDTHSHTCFFLPPLLPSGPLAAGLTDSAASDALLFERDLCNWRTFQSALAVYIASKLERSLNFHCFQERPGTPPTHLTSCSYQKAGTYSAHAATSGDSCGKIRPCFCSLRPLLNQIPCTCLQVVFYLLFVIRVILPGFLHLHTKPAENKSLLSDRERCRRYRPSVFELCVLGRVCVCVCGVKSMCVFD